jgi:ubiquinone/menaquinone biosynthesis C-methylase UbiE
MKLSSILDCELVDLGDLEGPAFDGVMVPESEVGKIGGGVTVQFLEDASQYHDKYFDTAFTDYLIKDALAKIDPPANESLILDIGSGSGPTVVSLLRKFSQSNVIATDISKNMLAILRSVLAKHDMLDRVATLCLDLNKDLFKGQSFDFAIGSAILHHLFEPEVLISQLFSTIKPGGSMVFFEPFEPGHVFASMIYRTILAESKSRDDLSPEIRIYFERLVLLQASLGCYEKDRVKYADIDDKWTFTKSYFEKIATNINARKLTIYPLLDSTTPFQDHLKTYLRIGLNKNESALPGWVWELVGDIENDLTPSCREDLLLSGGIIFTK